MSLLILSTRLARTLPTARRIFTAAADHPHLTLAPGVVALGLGKLSPDELVDERGVVGQEIVKRRGLPAASQTDQDLALLAEMRGELREGLVFAPSGTATSRSRVR